MAWPLETPQVFPIAARWHFATSNLIEREKKIEKKNLEKKNLEKNKKKSLKKVGEKRQKLKKKSGKN